MNASTLISSRLRLETSIQSEPSHQSGFTLIEVMVALMILAVVAVASFQASSGYLRTVDGMKTRTLANFVAQNAAARLTYNEDWLTAPRQERVNEQGRAWQVTYTPTILQEVPNQNIQSVTINVAEIIEGTENTGAGSETSITLHKIDSSN